MIIVALTSHYTTFTNKMDFDISDAFIKENYPLAVSIELLGINYNLTVTYRVVLNEKEYIRRKLTNSTLLTYNGIVFMDEEIKKIENEY